MSACFRHAFWNRTTRDAKERGPLTRINMGLWRDDLITLRQRAPCARKQGEQLISDARNRDPRRPLVPNASWTAARCRRLSFAADIRLRGRSEVNVRFRPKADIHCPRG